MELFGQFFEQIGKLEFLSYVMRSRGAKARPSELFIEGKAGSASLPSRLYVLIEDAG
jgi:hypothetical protein